MKNYGFTTLAVNGPFENKDAFGAAAQPVYLSTTYAQPATDRPGEYAYSRGGNPTRADLEACLAALEGGRAAFAFASGMAAISTVFNLFNSGDHIVINNNVYGGTFRYAAELFAGRGLSASFIDDFNSLDFDSLPKYVKGIFIETPSNPLLKITDIRRTAEEAHKRGMLVIVDNTFMTSYLQRPLELGADIVLYSATKYYGGHSDILAGLVTANDAAICEKLKLLQNTTGNALSPFDCALMRRSIKTLALRMERHETNAKLLIEFLLRHKNVKKIFHPSTAGRDERRIHAAQSKGDGAVFSMILRDGIDIEKFAASLRLFQLAVSLGSVESLICRPASMTHESYTPEMRERAGITDSLLRVAVGIEDADDLIGDFDRALSLAEA